MGIKKRAVFYLTILIVQLFWAVEAMAAWEVLRSYATIISPTRANQLHAYSDKRTPGQTHVLQAEFYTGNLFLNNPNAYIALLADGSKEQLPAGTRGRGLLFGNPNSNISVCTTLSITNYTSSGISIVGCGANSAIKNYNWYKIVLHVSDGWTAAWVYDKSNGNTLISTASFSNPDYNQQPMSNIIFMVTGDTNSSTSTITNLLFTKMN